jgi:hypothetical protein
MGTLTLFGAGWVVGLPSGLIESLYELCITD